MIWSAASSAGALDDLVAKDAAREAEKAFKSGDRRYIVVPVCGEDAGEVILAWPVEDYPKDRDAMTQAMESGRRPISCADYGDDPKQRNFSRAVRYAHRYNRRLLELESGAAR